MLDYFELGRILKPQGLRGEVKAELYTDNPDRFRTLQSVFFKSGKEMSEKRIVSARSDGTFVYFVLEGISDRTQAEQYRNYTFYIDRKHAAPLEPGSFYIADLIGLEVHDETGQVLGVVSDIFQNGAADVYSIKGDKPFMFPGIREVFIERSPEKGIIILNSGKLAEIALYDI